MSIRATVTRGFGSYGSIAEVVTRGYTIAEVVEPAPDASLTTRGYGQNGSIARLVTRYYAIGGVVADETVTGGSRNYQGLRVRERAAMARLISDNLREIAEAERRRKAPDEVARIKARQAEEFEDRQAALAASMDDEEAALIVTMLLLS